MQPEGDKQGERDEQYQENATCPLECAHVGPIA
jgi:hypothetical protein